MSFADMGRTQMMSSSHSVSSETVAGAVNGPRPSGSLLPDRLRPLTWALVTIACAISWAIYGAGGQALVTAVTASVLIVLVPIDIEHRILPNRIVLPAFAFVLTAQIGFHPDRALEWVLASVGAALFLALPLIVRPGQMGMGDIKLALLLGAAVGWSVFSAIIIGCLAMVPVAIWMLVRDGSIRNATLPFGPFLAIGTLVVLFTS